MKNLYLVLLALCCFAAPTSAQQTLDLMPADTAAIAAPANDTDVETHLVLHNSGAAMTIVWEREVIEITPGCRTQVCDPNACYTVAVSSKKFNLDANAHADMIMHFLNDTGSECCGIINLKMYQEGNPTNTITGTYLFNECAVSTSELQLPDLKLFPNPTTAFFQLENTGDATQIELFNRSGQLLKNFTVKEGEQYNIEDLNTGAYFLVLRNENGEALRAMELTKN